MRRLNKRLVRLFICAAVVIVIAGVAVLPSGTNAENVILDEFVKESPDEDRIKTIRAEILEIKSMQSDDIKYSGGSLETNTNIVKARIMEGIHENKVIEAVQTIDEFDPASNYEIRKGDKVLLYLDEDSNGEIVNAYVAELARDNYLLYLMAGFMLMLLLVGRGKGLKAIISLGITIIAVVKILLPLILAGYEPVRLSVAVCVGITAVTLIIVAGFNRKTLTALIGTSGGLLTAGLLALLVGSAARLTGLGNQESQMLLYIPSEVEFNFQGLLFASIIIGALGAVMDVGMSVASSMNEIENANPDIKTVKLIKGGMNVGKDIMGTMSNTLILAYTGGSMQFLLLLMAYDMPISEIINTDYLSSEVVRALAGSIGLIMTIPITAAVSGFLRNSANKRKINSESIRRSIDFR
jgi:uncharacterized membrane protein